RRQAEGGNIRSQPCGPPRFATVDRNEINAVGFLLSTLGQKGDPPAVGRPTNRFDVDLAGHKWTWSAVAAVHDPDFRPRLAIRLDARLAGDAQHVSHPTAIGCGGHRG